MESKEIVELITKEIEINSFLNISEFLQQNNLKNIKIKDLIKEIEENYNSQLILDSKNTEVYSYELVYNFFKLKMFKSLETGDDIDLSFDDFKAFKSEDVIRVFGTIDSEFIDYLMDKI